MKIQKKPIFNQYWEIGGRLQPNVVKIVPKLISIFSQIINEFEKQVQTLENIK